MNQVKQINEIARELGLNFSEENIGIMIKMLDLGMTSDNLVKLLEDIKAEMSCLA